MYTRFGPRAGATHLSGRQACITLVRDHCFVMSTHASATVHIESGFQFPGPIRRCQTTEVSLPPRLGPSARALPRVAAATACSRQSSSSGARHQHTQRRLHCSAAATEAEPIAFARTDAGEPEEEDFYSILGIVRTQKCCTPTALEPRLFTICVAHAAFQC